MLSLQTLRNYEHAFNESLVALLGSLDTNLTVQLVLTPGPGLMYTAREATAQAPRTRRSTGAIGATRSTPAWTRSIEAKELKGALETQHRSLLLLRPAHRR